MGAFIKKEHVFPIFGVLLVTILMMLGWSEFKGKFNPTKVGTQESIDEVTSNEYAVATFAGGCFWCTESDFEKVEGVKEVISGYAGGTEVDPVYKDVSSGKTSHREAAQVYYDPTIVSYDQLVERYWRHMDPTDTGGQFADRGAQYAPAIFYTTEEEKMIAQRSKEALKDEGRFEKEINTPIIEFSTFYPAEDYHQDYHTKNELRYSYYRSGSGRDAFLKKHWSEKELKEFTN